MEKEEAVKLKQYTLVIDEDRDSVLHIMMTSLEIIGFHNAFDALKELGIDPEVLKDFVKEISDKSHERDMCKSKDCKREVKNHE